MRVGRLLAPDLEEILRTDPTHAVALFDELHTADLVEVFESLSDDSVVAMLSAAPVEKAAEALDAMAQDARRVVIFEKLGRDYAAHIADVMSADERADLFAALSDDVRTDLLARMEKEQSRDVRDLLRYPETSAGGLMTTDYVALPADITVEKAIDYVRKSAEETETIYDVYVVDPNGTLLGQLSLRDLVLARALQPVSGILDADVVSVSPEMDQEDVAGLFQRYDLLALPVVDAARKLLGIVTVDDVVHVLKEEQAEDIQKLGAVLPTDTAYFQTDFWTLVRKRAGWLVAIFLGEIWTATALEHFDWVTSSAAAVTVFIPLIISSGGNTGSQASSLVIRGLALGEFDFGDARRILWREVRTGLALGVILGCIGVVRALLVGHSGGGGMALAVGVSLIACVTLGSVVGAGLPLLIKRLGLDPAVSSGPFIASLVDVLGIVIYLQIAIFMLGIKRH